MTISGDTCGVPHIDAKTGAVAVFGRMYVQAEDHFWQLETDYIRPSDARPRSTAPPAFPTIS